MTVDSTFDGVTLFVELLERGSPEIIKVLRMSPGLLVLGFFK
jgi:hypothetical protein